VDFVVKIKRIMLALYLRQLNRLAREKNEMTHFEIFIKGQKFLIFEPDFNAE